MDLSSLFLPIFVILQVLAMGGLLHQEKGAKAIIPFFLVLLVIDLAVLFGLTKVQAANGYKKPGDLLADLFTTAIWTVIASLVITVIGIFLSWRYKSGLPAILLPVATTAVFYLALWIMTYVSK